jgi:hypothetical protein
MTDKGVAALKARLKTYAVPDPELRGLWICRTGNPIRRGQPMSC